MDSLYNCRRPRRGVRIEKHRLKLKNEYTITLCNSETQEIYLTTEEFITFEEAVICANRSRHRLGLSWETLSIINTMKGAKHAFPTEKIKHTQ